MKYFVAQLMIQHILALKALMSSDQFIQRVRYTFMYNFKGYPFLVVEPFHTLLCYVAFQHFFRNRVPFLKVQYGTSLINWDWNFFFLRVSSCFNPLDRGLKWAGDQMIICRVKLFPMRVFYTPSSRISSCVSGCASGNVMKGGLH